MTLPRESHSTSGEGDIVVLAAAVCLVIGWFGMSTLVTQLAGVRHSFHFYDLWSVIENPTRLVTGLSGGDAAQGFAFGLICAAAAMSVFVPYRARQRSAWLACLIPLALMLVCGGLLYEKTSGDLFRDSGTHRAIASELVAFANTVAGRVSRSVARHISIGLGAYVSLAASVVLAARGLARYRST